MGTHMEKGGEEVMNYIEGATVLDGWVIIAKLGSGSFGTVYQIERKDEYGICERSALKVISVPQSPEDMKEILDEGMNDREASTYFNAVMRDIVREIAVMVETKSCEHIVRYEAHKVIAHEDGIGGDILIRMELLTSLPEYRRTHEMDESAIVRMGMELADALVYCEKKGLIHRDIKPQNIFVSENGTFKLGDFGIARRMQRTTGASRKGTEDYMAPEVYLRRHYGTTVDIYSLGLVMYKYANYGRLPFLPLPPTPPSFDDREQSLQNRMNGTPLPPPAEASEDLSAIILKACAYDPQKRYRSASDLKADLNVLSGESVIKWRNENPVNLEDVVHTSDHAESSKDNDFEKTVGGWTESVNISKMETMPETDSILNIEKESVVKHEAQIEKLDAAKMKGEKSEPDVKVPTMSNQLTRRKIMKKAIFGILPVISFWLIIQCISRALGTLSAGVIMSVLAIENLLGIKIACKWVDSIYGQAIEQRSEIRRSQIKQIVLKSIAMSVGIAFLIYAWIEIERGAGIEIQDYDGFWGQICTVCNLSWPVNLLSKMSVIKLYLHKKHNGEDKVDDIDVIQMKNNIMAGRLAAVSIFVIGIAVTIWQSFVVWSIQNQSGYYDGTYARLGIAAVMQLPVWVSIGAANGVQPLIRDCIKASDKKFCLKIIKETFLLIVGVFIAYAILEIYWYNPIVREILGIYWYDPSVTILGILPGICYLLASVMYEMKEYYFLAFLYILEPVLMVISEFVIFTPLYREKWTMFANLLIINAFWGIVMIGLFFWYSKKYWKHSTNKAK